MKDLLKSTYQLKGEYLIMVKNKNVRSRVVKRKKKASKKRLLFALSTVLILFVAVLGFAFKLYTKADTVLSDSYENDGRDKSELRDKIVDPKFDNVSILIMGVDASDKRSNSENARTDSLMLATLNKDEKSVKLVSIPRDSYVYIPEVDYSDKINHAHAYGGTQATIETVENLFHIPVDYYLKVNFEAFIDVVDALDGIKVEVPYEFKEQDSKDRANRIHLQPGFQSLNGEEALALARTRKLDNDIERGKRQQEIISSIVDRTVSVSSILKYDDIIEAIGSNMTTNMTFTEMKSFISYGTNGTNIDIDSITLDGIDYKPERTYYWKIDDMALDETRRELRNHLELEPESSTVSEQSENEYGNTDASY